MKLACARSRLPPLVYRSHAPTLMSLVLACLAGFGCSTYVAHGDTRSTKPPAVGDLRVVTYNVAREFGLRGDTSLWLGLFHRVPANLLSLPELTNARVVALQEVCDDGQPDGIEQWLARMPGPGWRGFFARNDSERHGACAEGQLTLVRGALLNWGILELPRVRRAGRVATWVEFRHAGRLVRVWNLHLNRKARTSSPTFARLRQVATVLADVADFRQRHPRGVAVVAGDFNLRDRSEPSFSALGRSLSPALPIATGTHVLGWPLDGIWFAGGTLRRSAVVPLGASDHHAVVATISLVARKAGRSAR